MKKLIALSAAALIGVGAFTADDAEARHRRGHGAAVAAGVIGGLAAGALIGAAASNAYAAPAYGYGPVVADDYDYAPAPVYRTTRVVRRTYAPVAYEYEYAPSYRATRVVRSYEYVPAPTYRTVRTVRTYDAGYRPASYGSSWGGPSYYGW